MRLLRPLELAGATNASAGFRQVSAIFFRRPQVVFSVRTTTVRHKGVNSQVAGAGNRMNEVT